MKDKINKFLESIDKVKILIENKKWKTKYKKLEKAYDLLYMDNVSATNEATLVKNEKVRLQQEKRELLIAYKHEKELLKQIKISLMKEGTTLRDIKNALGVK